MKKTNYTNLKDRVMALERSYAKDDWGGYQENWQEQGLLWAHIQPLKALQEKTNEGHNLTHSSFQVVVRAYREGEKIQGFYWKKWLLRVMSPVTRTACQRFFTFRTNAVQKG